MSFINHLISKKIISEDDSLMIEKELGKEGKTLESILNERGLDKNKLIEEKSDWSGVPGRLISDESPIPFEVLNMVPEKSAMHYKFIPLAVNDGVLEIGMVDPDDHEARDAMQFVSAKTRMPFKIFVILEEDFSKAIGNFKGLTGEVSKALNELESELSIEERELSKSVEDLSRQNEHIAEDAPVTKIVANILHSAIDDRASDIHVEPTADKIRVRFRVDGSLNNRLALPMNAHSAVVARIKILSGMKLDEKRKPQDGRFSTHINGRKIDFRVSTFPTYFGEKVVMRILDTQGGIIGLDGLGITPDNLAKIRKGIERPYGLILISGPTGSGKSTTLYSMLSEIDREQNNVLSLEDPVEYNIEGVSQSQVRPEIGYTFARGLRTTLRQDPDIIMVGEIRDKETARLAIQAALTGHLVLSTIHTNNAFGVIPRLIDMGIDPYLIAPTLVLAIAQRLARTLAPGEHKAIPIEGSVKELIDKQFSDLPPDIKSKLPVKENVFEALPSEKYPSGTKGRVAVMEVLEINKELENLILKDPTESAITAVARKNGMLTMKEDAIIKAMDGKIPFSEIMKL